MSLTAKKTGTLFGTAAINDSITALLMHCDGTNGGTSFTDSSNYNQTITNAGSVITSTTAKQFGTSSFYTNGSTGNYYLSATSTALMFGTSNFTIEFWMNPSDPVSLTRNQRLMGNLPLNTFNSGCWAIGFNTSNGGKLHMDINNVLNNWVATTAQVAGTWYHIALVRSGSTWYFFQNGILQSTTTSSASFDNGGTARPVYFGWSGYSTSITNEYYNGYLDEIRFTNGRALYTSNFNVPTSPFSTGQTTLSLPGTNGNYMLLPSTHPTNFDPGASSLFIEAWVYWNGANFSATNGGTIYERENAGPTVQDYGLYTDNTGILTSYMYTQNGSILRPTSTALAVKTWYHVAFGYSTLNQTAYIWLNGNIGTTATASNPARYSSINTFIGNSPLNAGAGQTYAWNGYIQDMRVTKGGIIPTTSFTPVSPPFSLLAPSYVPGGTCVLSMATQYFLNTLTNITPSGRAGGYGADVTGGDQTRIIAGNKVHFFTTVGTTTVTVTGSGFVNVLIVAGGGGGGYDRAGGGGAGGLIFTQMILQPGTYTVTVGNGGAGRVGSNGNGSNGQDSVFGSLTAIGGGGGGSYAAGFAGGSGGGGFGTSSAAGGAAGPNNQGNIGGAGLNANLNSGGGGGAAGVGVAGGNGINAVGGNGGPGRLVAISGTPTYYAGGGGGSIAFDSFSGTSGKGLGGVGGGGNSGQVRGANGSAGTANTGGGGGGGANIPQGNGGNGGSGIIIVSYPTTIPSQITNYIPPVPIFSQISAGAKTSSTVAYSLRSLSTATARVVNIRRSSDSATLDFYAKTDGTNLYSLTNILLQNWLAGSTGYVTVLYDQSGNTKDMIQGTAANQPIINLTTTPYSIIFNGNNSYLYNSAVTFNMGAGVFTLRYLVENVAGGCVVHKSDNLLTSWTARSKKFWLGDGTINEGLSGLYPSQVGNSEDFIVSAGAGTGKFSVVHKATATSVVPIYINGTNQTLSRNTLNMGTDPGNYLILGAGAASAYYAGSLYEVELFSTALSDADRLLLEN
jgi:hypothetical protein